MVKVRFFAMLRERLKCHELDVCLPEDVTVEDLRRKLVFLHPEWEQDLYDGELLCAKNYSFVDWTARINDGDEVAFFPPVTGG